MKICQPWPGSSAAGVPILTPAIGPEMVGLSGLELFETSHAVDRTASNRAVTQRARMLIPTPQILYAEGALSPVAATGHTFRPLQSYRTTLPLNLCAARAGNPLPRSWEVQIFCSPRR